MITNKCMASLSPNQCLLKSYLSLLTKDTLRKKLGIEIIISLDW